MNTQDREYLTDQAKIIYESDFDCEYISLVLYEAYAMGRAFESRERLEECKKSQ